MFWREKMSRHRKARVRGAAEESRLAPLLRYLDRREIATLESLGYCLDGIGKFQEGGEGQTRRVFRIQLKKGGVEKDRWLYVPKKPGEINQESVCTLINRTKGDLDARETATLNTIQHPNIAETVDSVPGTGRTLTLSQYSPGTDLGVLIKTTGQITDPDKIKGINSQFLAALAYLHGKGIAHRDVKPSNVIVSEKGGVKLIDLQNAASVWDIRDKAQPTRGGTAFAYPELLNALATGQEARADCRTDVYGFGASLYEQLTGRVPIGYKVIRDPNGRPIEVGGKEIRVKLMCDDQEIQEITKKDHEARLKKALRQLPKPARRYKGLIRRCMTMLPGQAFYDARTVQEKFDQINNGLWPRIREKIPQTLKGILYSAAGAAAVAGVIALGRWQERQEKHPTLVEILRRDEWRQFTLSSLMESPDRDRAIDVFYPNLEPALKRLGEIEKRDMARYISCAKDSHSMPPRLVASWLRACYLHQDKNRSQEGEDTRTPISRVPKDFVMTVMHGAGTPRFDETSDIISGIFYLKQCMGPGKTVAEVLADYFCTRDEVHRAVLKTRSKQFLPYSQDSTLYPGFQEFLPYEKAERIKTALALYMVTKDDGEIDVSKMPRKIHLGNRNMYELPESVKENPK